MDLTDGTTGGLGERELPNAQPVASKAKKNAGGVGYSTGGFGGCQPPRAHQWGGLNGLAPLATSTLLGPLTPASGLRPTRGSHVNSTWPTGASAGHSPLMHTCGYLPLALLKLGPQIICGHLVDKLEPVQNEIQEIQEGQIAKIWR